MLFLNCPKYSQIFGNSYFTFRVNDSYVFMNISNSVNNTSIFL